MPDVTRFNTGKVRISYPHIFQKDQNGKYSLVALVPKTDTATVNKIEEACQQVYAENKNTVFKGLDYDEVSKPYHDGDGRKPKGGAYGPECKGMLVLSAKSSNKPVLVDSNKQAVVDESELYPGTWGRVGVKIAAYNAQGNKGICCYLNGVLTYNRGERFGAGFSASEFDDEYDDSDMLDDDDEI